MIFISSKLLYIFCFILLFTSSSPCRKHQLPFHIYFSTKILFGMLHFASAYRVACVLLGVVAQSVEAVKRLVTFAGCD